MKNMQKILSAFKRPGQQPGNDHEHTAITSSTIPLKYWTVKDSTSDDYCVYGLVDRWLQQIVYVGMTYDLEKRFQQHYSSRTIDNQALASWCQEQHEYGGFCYCLFAEHVTFVEAGKLETRWIQQLTAQGFSLLNIGKMPPKSIGRGVQ